jgi:hypothetical protein
LAERIDAIEKALEDVGLQAELVAAMNAYVSELRREAKSILVIRWLALVFGAVFVVFVLSMLVCLLYFRDVWLFLDGETFRTAIFVSSMAASVLVVGIVLRGAFKSSLEMHASDVLPESVKNAFDFVHGVFK